SVLELAAPFAMSQPAISKHLKVLERAGLISRGRDAQRRPCRLEAQPLAEANAWLEGDRGGWGRSFEQLGALVEGEEAGEGAGGGGEGGRGGGGRGRAAGARAAAGAVTGRDVRRDGAGALSLLSLM